MTSMTLPTTATTTTPGIDVDLVQALDAVLGRL